MDHRSSTGNTLARADGTALLSASDAILKAVLESEVALGLLAVPAVGVFSAVAKRAEDPSTREILERHRIELRPVGSSVRGASLALAESRVGRAAGFLALGSELSETLEAIARETARGPLEGPLLVIAEDRAADSGTTCPRWLARAHGCWCIEPSDIRSLLSSIDIAAQLSSSSGSPCVIVLARELLQQHSTVELRANRVVESVDQAPWLRRRMGSRSLDSADPLRIVRRSEVNRMSSLPSPGEREPLGFIAVGACALPTLHMLTELGLATRVPLLRLGSIEPLDESAIERMLDRVTQAIVVEARPGTVGPRVLEVAQRMRATNPGTAMVYWSKLPPPMDGPPGEVMELLPGDGLSTSLLTRKAIHLLHQVRPGLHVARRLAPLAADLASASIPPRGSSLGLPRVRALLSSAIDDVSVTLSQRPPESTPPSFEFGGGAAPVGRRSLPLELWGGSEFAALGVPSVAELIRQGRNAVCVVFLSESERGVDPERLLRACAIGDEEQRLVIERAEVPDRKALRALLERAADFEGVTLVLLRDGVPPRIDPDAGNREAAALDAAGFRSLQRVVWPADAACDIREFSESVKRACRGGVPVSPIPREARVERREAPPGVRFRLRIEPVLEQIEVVRSRPPGQRDSLREPPRLPPPPIMHGQQGIWRVHIAGIRGSGLGVCGSVLATAGQIAGYRVDAIAESQSIAVGRGAWSQVAFSRAGTGESARAYTARIPYGEADLLLGVDPIETIRALGADPCLCVGAPGRTSAVVSTSPPEGESPWEEGETLLRRAVLESCDQPNTIVGDLAGHSRRNFLTDRSLDLTLLGMAWQRGFIPLPVAAIESGLRAQESAGVSRCLDAFNLGRLLVGDASSIGPAIGEGGRSSSQLVRMISLAGALRGVGAHQRARALQRLIESATSNLQGIDAGSEGEQVLCDLVVGIERCVIWGGIPVAKRYIDTIRRLHAAHGAVLSAPAVLPLADGTLPRDFLYVGLMSASFEHRRRIRQALGVRAARGDTLERRYLTRLDLCMGGKRWIVDFRSSDWPARVLRAIRPAVPDRWRGSPESLARRDALFECFRLASIDPRPMRWVPFARTLHQAALEGKLRSMKPADVLRLAPGE